MMSSATFTTIPDMIQYLDTLIFTVQGREKQPTQRAVLEAQSFDPSMQARSTVFVFTDSLDEDAGPANYTLASKSIESQLVLQSLAWNNRVRVQRFQKQFFRLSTSSPRPEPSTILRLGTVTTLLRESPRRLSETFTPILLWKWTRF